MTTHANGEAAGKMQFTEIDGVKVVHEFIVLWHLWECDGYGWVTEDGRVYLSTHGKIFEAPDSEVIERLEAALSCADGIRKALALAAEVRENAKTEPEVGRWSIGTKARPQHGDENEGLP